MKVKEIDRRVKELRKTGAIPEQMLQFWQSLSKEDNKKYLKWVRG